MSNTIFQPVLITRGQLLSIEARPGRRLIGVRGTVWITQAGRGEDWVLGHGNTLDLEHPGHVLVNAVGGDAVLAYSADLAVRFATGPAVAERRRANGLGAAIARIQPRYDPCELASLPHASRLARIEAEAAWMRSQVARVLWRHLAASIARGWARARAAWLPRARKRQTRYQ